VAHRGQRHAAHVHSVGQAAVAVWHRIVIGQVVQVGQEPQRSPDPHQQLHSAKTVTTASIPARAGGPGRPTARTRARDEIITRPYGGWLSGQLPGTAGTTAVCASRSTSSPEDP
jgi:hypothetical protein